MGWHCRGCGFGSQFSQLKKGTTSQKQIFYLITDIKRSQDSAQIEMVKALNSELGSGIQGQYFVSTQDILCAAKALIEETNVVIESKGLHYIVFNHKELERGTINSAFEKRNGAKLLPKASALFGLFKTLDSNQINNVLNHALKFAKNLEKKPNNMNLYTNILLALQNSS